MSTPDPQNPQPAYTPPPAPGGYPAAPDYSATQGAGAYPGQGGAYPAAAQGDVPGRTLSIVGLVFAFLVPLLGFILSLVARSKLKKAGAPTGLATAGFWIGLILFILETIGLIVGIVLFSSIFSVCNELGAGVWQVSGVTYTCS